MTTRIEITGHTQSPATDARLALSAELVEPQSLGQLGDRVELQITTSNGASGRVRLSTAEAATLAVLLSKVVDDFDRREADPLEKVIVDGGRTITRDELIGALLLLPRSAEIDARIGGQYVGITGLERAGDDVEAWWTLECNPRCVKDLLIDWHVPQHWQEQILRGDL
ncbi:hypothetical protein [Actinoplanes sp. NBRC 103695]|uniref:hypothetical protein n=1 Tax=Actinoplanes sp. NBRC 103695 TaxID=3032202 RepID=UPI0024A34865|nr:hypothetical protein [Actinoplanes sp. NBRC 103695]GLZ01625.1 hypothetical protein Acsp02_88760 [Actinoplanes sp. NBRC 103695]